MRHTVHLMLGKESEQILCDMRSYMIKYGDEEHNHYFQAILYTEETTGDAIFSVAEVQDDNRSRFESGIEGLYKTALGKSTAIPKDHKSEYLNNFFANLYNRTITINDPGDSPSLHLCIFIPLYDPHYWDIAKTFLTSIEYIPQNYSVDLFLLPYDLAFLFEANDNLPLKIEQYKQQTRTTVDLIIKAKMQYRSLAHMVLVQNCNAGGIALNLNAESFVRILGEYALLSVSNYVDMFNPATFDAERPITALGLSVLSFDKYHFVQYLLHKAYKHILDRERVLQEEVDVNMVSRIVQKILTENVDIFTKFYEREIQPKLDKGDSQDDIISKIEPTIKQEIEHLAETFQSYIDDEKLSLPEKRATLAQLLGEDDELLIGYMFNKKQLVIDDCSREVLDWFVHANNQLIEYRNAHLTKSTIDHTDLAAELPTIADDQIADYAVLSGSTQEPVATASELIDKLKSVKVSMRESSHYIRQKELELQSINIQMHEHNESHKRLTKNGFIFDGHEYMLIPDVIEKPCEEDYVPVENHQTKVDLRDCFTPVKDQSILGACSAFTMVGIFEYILKTNYRQEMILSESFVYYNVRKAEHKEKEDSGSSLNSVIVSIGTEGVCLEQLCPYSTEPDIRPNPEAYADAQTRKIVKALNVKPKVEDIKSAIAQGYPVAVSLKIFDSFNADAGFVQRPSNEEIQSNHSGNHAMIVCGYSDDEKIFIVRNSWGTKFGDKGYCYIPYSYLADKTLLNVACIIKEINDTKIVVGSNQSKTTVSFDMSNSLIRSNILKVLIGEEQQKLLRLDSLFKEYTFMYNTLLQSLGNNSTRSTLCDGTIKRLHQETCDLEKEKAQMQNNRIEDLQEFDHATNINCLYVALFVLGYILIYAMLCYWFPANIILANKVSYIGYGIVSIMLALSILWYKKRKHDRTELDQHFQIRLNHLAEGISRREQEIQVMKLKSHISGMIIDNLFKLSAKLHAKYNGLCSYVRNLSTWRREVEAADTDIVSPSDLEPFLSLNSDKCMDVYFEREKEALTQNIKLYALFKEQYQIDETAIIQFKNDLKNKLVNELFSFINGFSIYAHIVGEAKYPYVEQKYTDIHRLLQLMDEKSETFVRMKDVVDSVSIRNCSNKILFIRANLETEQAKWKELCNKNFQHIPILCSTKSDCKITLLQLNGISPNEISLLQA